jgi:hypothetical protein
MTMTERVREAIEASARFPGRALLNWISATFRGVVDDVKEVGRDKLEKVAFCYVGFIAVAQQSGI